MAADLVLEVKFNPLSDTCFQRPKLGANTMNRSVWDFDLSFFFFIWPPCGTIYNRVLSSGILLYNECGKVNKKGSNNDYFALSLNNIKKILRRGEGETRRGSFKRQKKNLKKTVTR